jgi:hypothetical protein
MAMNNWLLQLQQAGRLPSHWSPQRPFLPPRSRWNPVVARDGRHAGQSESTSW